MQLKRSELYSRVCNAPLSKLAPELGLTGTALAAATSDTISRIGLLDTQITWPFCRAT